MINISFKVPGEAVSQGRPRATTVNGRVRMYDPAKSRNYKKHIQSIAGQYAPAELIEGPIYLKVVIYRKVLKSFSKKKRQEALDGILLPVSKPDVDNYAKTFMDALNGVIWKDDSQVVTLVAEKHYGEEAYSFIEIQTL